MIFISSTDNCPEHDKRIIDEHVPISFRSYSGLLGAKYLRVGDFQTTLLEFLLDPISYTIRGITLTSLDKIHVPCEPEIILESFGLPIVDVGKSDLNVLVEARKAEVSCQFSVGIESNFLEVDFSEIKNANRKINCGRVQFFLKNEELSGVRFVNLTIDEIAILQKHIAGIRQK
jgi:hypothetical protein